MISRSHLDRWAAFPAKFVREAFGVLAWLAWNVLATRTDPKIGVTYGVDLLGASAAPATRCFSSSPCVCCGCRGSAFGRFAMPGRTNDTGYPREDTQMSSPGRYRYACE